MTDWPSASSRRWLLAGTAALLLGCSASRDNLGQERVSVTSLPPGAGGSAPGRVTTVLGKLACPTTYPNAYHDILGRRQDEIDKKVKAAFEQLFDGDPETEAIYFESGTDQAVIKDILHNNEVRTEGMGLAMVALAMRDDGRDRFNRLWRYTINNLEYPSGYFKSRCDYSESATSSSSLTRECADPYGLQQFVMALLLARQRWVPGSSSPDYTSEAIRLFDIMRNTELDNGVAGQGNSGASGQASQGGAAGVDDGATGGGNASFTVAAAGATPSSSAGGASGAAGTAVTLAGASGVTSATIGSAGSVSKGGSAGGGGKFSGNAGGGGKLSGSAGGVGKLSGSAGGGGKFSGGAGSGGAATLGSASGGTANSGTDASEHGQAVDATNTFDPKTKLVYLEPNAAAASAAVTATALELPGYYAVWAQVTGDAFYDEAAAAARNFLRKVANSDTGLVPVRATFDAKPVQDWGDFTAEAYRVLLNLVIDRVWGNASRWQDAQIDAMLDFFLRKGIDDYASSFTLDGEWTLMAGHATELVMVNGVIASISNIADADRRKFVEAAWATPIPTGSSRYYPAIMYLVSTLILAGEFQLCPQ
jgi:endo-1,4-beta-D-glucanase Y